jgi:hypothetical protein
MALIMAHNSDRVPEHKSMKAVVPIDAAAAA